MAINNYIPKTSIPPEQEAEINLDKLLWLSAWKLAQERDRSVWRRILRKLNDEAGEGTRKLVAKRASIIFNQQR